MVLALAKFCTLTVCNFVDSRKIVYNRDHLLVLIHIRVQSISLCNKFPYSGLYWSVFSPNAGKYGPE